MHFGVAAAKQALADSGFEITDEAFFLMTWAKDPAPKMLATSPVAPTRSAPPRISSAALMMAGIFM